MEKKKGRLGSNTTNILAAVILICLVIALAGILLMPNASSTPDTPDTFTITDMSGNTVEIPLNINRIAITCCGGATHEVMVMGGSDMIVAQPAKCIMPQLEVMEPGFANVADAGSFNDVNVEEILSLRPDVVIASITAEKGNEKLSESEIPVVTVMTGRGNMSQIKKEFATIGRVLGCEDRSGSLISYWDEKIAQIQDRTSTIPADQRKTVYYMLGKTTHTNGGGWWGQEFITTAGGINVAEELGIARDTSIEQIVEWNPDVIIISSNEGTFIPISEVEDNTQLGSIAAVKNGEIHECPIGSFWWDRPSPEAPLGMLWLAKTLYPDKFSDIDLKSETEHFYRTFYGYTLSDEEYGKFLNPQPGT